MRKIETLLVLVFAWAAAGLVHAQACRVLDAELQDGHAGPCLNGLAEGYGSAVGTAQYVGDFRAGRKHGKGVKTWRNGDRYEGDFVEDRKEGFGVYLFGHGPWAGERYEGEFLNDRRHGHGVYRWSTGDVYTGPWKLDVATGKPTQAMQAKRKADEEARVAVAKQGEKVCREMAIGIALREWVRGIVVAVAPDKVAVRIEDPGAQPHSIAGVEVNEGQVIWDRPQHWTPCW
jgi:hypothetical protein